MKHHLIPALLLAAGLAGCTVGSSVVPPAPALPSVPAGADDTCAAAPYAGLVGQDATALERVEIMREIRIIRPGMAVTRDFRAGRINFDIDVTNRITRIYCG